MGTLQSQLRHCFKKIQLSKLEDLIGFIQQFMNRAASRPAYRKELQGALQSGRLLQPEEENEWIVFRQGHLPGGLTH